MRRRLYRHERLDAVLRQLQEDSYVSVAELADSFGVSTVTVRSDLELLEKSGQLLRTHGGAVPIQMGEGALSFSVRQRSQVQAKERIGAAAAELVADGEAIVLDASTTSWHMARRLVHKRDLTVVTTGLYVALELLRAPGISVIIPGGPVWREAASVVGKAGLCVLADGNLQKGFFGGRGLDLVDGLTDAHLPEVELKRDLVGTVRQVNAIVDSTKLGKVAFASCASIGQIDRILTDREADPDLISAFRDRGVQVILV